MQIQENISLRPYNTFGIEASARYFSKFSTIEELTELLTSNSRGDRLPVFILGGGSNILLTKDFEGLVLKNEIKGITKAGEDDDFVFIRAGAGENWHEFVMYCVENNLAGVENLSLIPGSVGASPMQNIGAYGVELAEVFLELKAFNLQEKSNYTFGLKDCEFGYRESVFKNKYKDQFVILNVTFKLRKKPIFNTSYGAIEEELARMNVNDLSIKAVSQAVINIRKSKLADPAEIGNAGSFFKNPVVSMEKFLELKDQFPGIVGFTNPDHTVKLAAGWLVENTGPDDISSGGEKNFTSWKGYRKGNTGSFGKQALVLVNYGNAAGQEVYELSEEILQSVDKKFGVTLEREVNIV